MKSWKPVLVRALLYGSTMLLILYGTATNFDGTEVRAALALCAVVFTVESLLHITKNGGWRS